MMPFAGAMVLPIMQPQAWALPSRVLQSHHAGVVKSFNAEKGWGFIIPSSHQFGKDVFVMQSALAPGTSINPGDKVQFKIKEGRKGYEADDVHVVPDITDLSGQTFSGLVKSYNPVKGWGFIESE